MKNFIKKIFLSLGLLFFSKLKRGASVLMFHSVGKNDAFFTVSLDMFIKYLKIIKEHNLSVVNISTLVDMQRRGLDISGYVSITFDDGYLDILENALPILRSFGYKASVFVIPDLMGKTYTTSDSITLPLFSFDDFFSFGASDTFEILPHTKSHKELSSLGYSEQEGEISESWKKISATFETNTILAYPRGKYNTQTISILKNLKWNAACTTKRGIFSKKSDIFMIPRNSVDSKTSLLLFRSYLSDVTHFYAIVLSWIS